MSDEHGAQPPDAAMSGNTSGQYGPVPDEVLKMGFNFGAFWWSWIWGIAHGVPNSLLVIVLPLIWNIVLGVNGNRWGWQGRRFESVEDFARAQRYWAKWAWIALLAVALFCGVATLAFFFMLSPMPSAGP